MSRITDISNNVLEVLELLPTGEYNVTNIKNLTPHHWKTIEDYLKIFIDIKNSDVELLKKKDVNGSIVNLTNKKLNNLSLPPESYYLIFLFLSKAFNKEKSIQLKVDKEILNYMLHSEMIGFNDTGKKIFLTYRGISVANTLTSMIKNNKFVPEEQTYLIKENLESKDGSGIMTLTNTLEEFFGLENNLELFTEAITPPSCGGGKEFEYLAFIGDKILNLSLIDILTHSEATDKGKLTKFIDSFHNGNTLHEVSLFLQLDKLMKPINKQIITKNDLKEAVEALLGACYKIHGLEKPKTIVTSLLNEVETNEVSLDINYIGLLQEYAKENKFPDPVYSYSDNLGSPHKAIYYCTVKFLELEFTSDRSRKKAEARKNAARKMMLELGLANEDGTQKSIKPQIETVPMNVKQSIDQRTLVFEKAETSEEDQTINVKSQTGEKLVDWAQRKARKNPFGMLVLLSARMKEFSGASWLADLETYSLAILNLKYNSEQYFAIGMGSSRTKARKEVANRIIEESDLYNILETQYSDEFI